MRDQSDRFACAAATANGFAMPYRRSTPIQPEKERRPREKEVAQPPGRTAKVDASSRRAD
jgi:hypothetical protein